MVRSVAGRGGGAGADWAGQVRPQPSHPGSGLGHVPDPARLEAGGVRWSPGGGAGAGGRPAGPARRMARWTASVAGGRGSAAPPAATRRRPTSRRRSRCGGGGTRRRGLGRLRLGGPLKQDPAGGQCDAAHRTAAPAGTGGCQESQRADNGDAAGRADGELAKGVGQGISPLDRECGAVLFRHRRTTIRKRHSPRARTAEVRLRRKRAPVLATTGGRPCDSRRYRSDRWSALRRTPASDQRQDDPRPLPHLSALDCRRLLGQPLPHGLGGPLIGLPQWVLHTQARLPCHRIAQ